MPMKPLAGQRGCFLIFRTPARAAKRPLGNLPDVFVYSATRLHTIDSQPSLRLETNENMKYTILLWPHANARYRNEARKLALAELAVMLGRLAPDARFQAADVAGSPPSRWSATRRFPTTASRRCGSTRCCTGCSPAEKARRCGPVAGRAQPYLGEDLPGILKYKGKTNELFTQMLVNVALYSGEYWRQGAEVRLLDPMCGKGTTLFVGANRGWSCVGSDVDRAELREAEQFFQAISGISPLQTRRRPRRADPSGRPERAGVRFSFSDTADNFKAGARGVAAAGQPRCGGRARRVRRAGVSRNRLRFALRRAARVARRVARAADGAFAARVARGARARRHVGGVVQRADAQARRGARWMARAGLEPLEDGPYLEFSHWVEQAVTRDVAVARRR